MENNPFTDAEPPKTDTASSFFDSGSASCRFNNIGDVHAGQVLDFEEQQQRDIKTKAPAVWPDGNPKMMLVVTLQTDERDEAIDDDDGKRRLYVNKPSGMFAAIKNAIGKQTFAVGGQLAVKYTGNGKSKSPGFNPPKEYAAKYQSPNGHAAPAQPAQAPQQTVGQSAARKAAWESFRRINPGKTTDQMADAWRALVAETYPGVDAHNLTAAQWTALNAKIESGLLDAQPVDDIPF